MDMSLIKTRSGLNEIKSSTTYCPTRPNPTNPMVEPPIRRPGFRCQCPVRISRSAQGIFRAADSMSEIVSSAMAGVTAFGVKITLIPFSLHS